MRTFRHIIVLLLVLASATAAGAGEGDLAGCYSLDQGGDPWLRIEETDGTYTVTLKDRDGWNEGSSLHPGTQKELSGIFENDSSRIKSSLIADEGLFALFHVQAGEVYGGYKAKTDYITYILIGAGSAYKNDCID